LNISATPLFLATTIECKQTRTAKANRATHISHHSRRSRYYSSLINLGRPSDGE